MHIRSTCRFLEDNTQTNLLTCTNRIETDALALADGSACAVRHAVRGGSAWRVATITRQLKLYFIDVRHHQIRVGRRTCWCCKTCTYTPCTRQYIHVHEYLCIIRVVLSSSSCVVLTYVSTHRRHTAATECH